MEPLFFIANILLKQSIMPARKRASTPKPKKKTPKKAVSKKSTPKKSKKRASSKPRQKSSSKKNKEVENDHQEDIDEEKLRHLFEKIDTDNRYVRHLSVFLSPMFVIII